MSSTNDKPILVVIGINANIRIFVEALKSIFEVIEKKYESSILESALEHPVASIVCGPPEGFVSTIELGQSLRMIYPDLGIYFLTDSRNEFDRPSFQKNGFTDAFLIPNDQEIVSSTMRREASRASQGKIKAYKAVHLIDIPPDETLGFDLYIHLPANNKKIRYVAASESLSAERSTKLKKHHHQAAFVSEDEVKKFYQFTAKQLKNLVNSTKISETEKAEKREKAVRDLLTGFFSDPGKSDSISSGKEMLTDCQEIIKEFIVDDSESKTSWYDRMMAIANAESSSYNHSANVATFASLLSIATGIGDPKDLAFAGLLHEIGLTSVPAEICLKEKKDRSEKEQALFEQYPFFSVNLIRERKLIVSEKIITIIEQHRERFDGAGFPNRMPGPRIIKEAQILAFAIALEELTRVQDGQVRITIPEAIHQICVNGLANPGLAPIDPTVLRKIKSIFPKEDQKTGIAK